MTYHKFGYKRIMGVTGPVNITVYQKRFSWVRLSYGMSRVMVAVITM